MEYAKKKGGVIDDEVLDVCDWIIEEEAMREEWEEEDKDEW